MENSNIPADLLSGIYSVENYNLQKQVFLKQLQNKVLARYIHLIQKETNDLKSMSESFLDESDDEMDVEVGLQEMKKTYERIYKMFVPVTEDDGDGGKNLAEAVDALKLSFNTRNQALKRLSMQIDAFFDDPNLKKLVGEHEMLLLKEESVQKTFELLQKEEASLSEMIKEKELRHKEVMEKKQEELDECVRNLKDAQDFMDSSAEDDLIAEIAALEDKQKELNRTLRTSGDEEDESPFIENFFKNPNDFPNLVRLLSPGRSSIQKNVVVDISAYTGYPNSRGYITATSEVKNYPQNPSTSTPKRRRHLKPVNCNTNLVQPQKTLHKSPRHDRSSSQNISPRESPRRLRSKRKVQENYEKAVEDQQPPTKVARVDLEEKSKEKLAGPSQGKKSSEAKEIVLEKPQEKVQELIVSPKTSRPKKLSQQLKRKLNDIAEKSKESPKKTKLEAQQIVDPSPEDPRDPVKDGPSNEVVQKKQQPQNTDKISIPETPTSEETAKEAESSAQPGEVLMQDDQRQKQQADEQTDSEEDEPDFVPLTRSNASINLLKDLNISSLSGSGLADDNFSIGSGEGSGNNSFHFGDMKEGDGDFFSSFSPAKGGATTETLF